jgi:hypothetical protein
MHEMFEFKAAEQLAYSPDEAAELLPSGELVHDLLRTGKPGQSRQGAAGLSAGIAWRSSCPAYRGASFCVPSSSAAFPPEPPAARRVAGGDFHPGHPTQPPVHRGGMFSVLT